MIPTKQKMQQQRVPNLPCPVCGQLIPVPNNQLLVPMSLHCPACGLDLSIDKKKSDKALEILAKLDEALKRVEDKSFRE